MFVYDYVEYDYVECDYDEYEYDYVEFDYVEYEYAYVEVPDDEQASWGEPLGAHLGGQHHQHDLNHQHHPHDLNHHGTLWGFSVKIAY